MSIVKVRAALEAALGAMTPALATVWENTAYTPVVGTPYQRAYLLPAEPDNSEYGATHREQGVFQVSLFYPNGTGSAAAAARAEMLRTTFKRGASFTKDGVTVSITNTPTVGAGTADGDRWHVPVKCRFISSIIA